jgi:hypothetical protein
MILAPAGLAQSQDLGHKIPGGVGLDAGTQPEPGIYIGDRVVSYRAGELKDRHGDTVPAQDLEIEALSNVVGFSRTIKLDGWAYFNISAAVPLSRISLSSEVPQVSLDRFGLGDVFIEPVKLGAVFGHVDVVTSYALYAPTGQTERSGVGQRQWSHQFSAGGTIFLDDRRGWRLSALGSYDLYQKKIGIDIRRGDSVQIQGGMGGPISRLVDVGLAGYALWQVRDDTGADLPRALRGARDRVFGFGPEVDVAIPAIRSRFTVRHEWDVGVRSRPKGHVLIAGVAFRVQRTT